MRAASCCVVFAFCCSLAGPAWAGQIYKWKKPDGSLVYTDNLSQLPNDRREYYNRIEQEEARKRQELEQAIGKEELQRREAEQQRVQIEKAKLEAAEREKRLAQIDATIKMIRERSALREGDKGKWQKRWKEALDKRDKLLVDFNAAQDKYNSLATKPNFTLLPGQAGEMEQAKKDMERLEKDLDAAIEEVQFKIPEEARKAGIPPGWLR